MNLFKKKSFWISLIILLIVAFLYGMHFAPNTVTTCIPEFGCDNDWGRALDYRAEVGSMAVLLSLIPAVLISLLISYFSNRSKVRVKI